MLFLLLFFVSFSASYMFYFKLIASCYFPRSMSIFCRLDLFYSCCTIIGNCRFQRRFSTSDIDNVMGSYSCYFVCVGGVVRCFLYLKLSTKQRYVSKRFFFGFLRLHNWIFCVINSICWSQTVLRKFTLRSPTVLKQLRRCGAINFLNHEEMIALHKDISI